MVRENYVRGNQTIHEAMLCISNHFWLGMFGLVSFFSLGSLADDLSFRNFATSDLWLVILRLSSSLCLTSEIPTTFGEVCAPPKWGSPCKLKAHCMGQGNWALCKLWSLDPCRFSSTTQLAKTSNSDLHFFFSSNQSIKHTQHIGPWSGLYPMPVDFVPSLLNRLSPLIQISSSRCFATF